MSAPFVIEKTLFRMEKHKSNVAQSGLLSVPE